MNVMNDLAEKTSSFDTALGPEERGFVYAVARRIVGSPEDAEDVTQEALLLAHRYRDSYRGEARFRTWLYRIASTAALGHLRRRRRSREVLAPTEQALGIEVPDQGKSPESELADAESALLVTRAVAELDPKYRDVVMCRASATDAETASRLGISVANVKIRAHRARKQLRPVLEALR